MEVSRKKKLIYEVSNSNSSKICLAPSLGSVSIRNAVRMRREGVGL